MKITKEKEVKELKEEMFVNQEQKRFA